MTTRPALGRGLNALIPTPSGGGADRDDAGAGEGPRTVAVESILPNPEQPRSSMNPTALEELAASIREHGVLQPLLVTHNDAGGFVIVAGERRWRAAQMAGLRDVPIVITDVTNSDALTIALVENIQREDLGPLEEAQAYRRLSEDLQLTQDQIAQRVGKSRATIANSLRLLRLPDPIRMSLGAGEISEGHARAILGAAEAEQQVRLWRYVCERQLNVRQTEAAVKRFRDGVVPTIARKRELPGDRLGQERLQTALSTKVRVQRGRRGGKIVIQWYDDEQLEQIVNQIAAAYDEPTPPAPNHIDI